MLLSTRSLALPRGQPIQHPCLCREHPCSRGPHPRWRPRDSPERRSPAAPLRRRRDRLGRPHGELTHGPLSPGSRRNPAMKGKGCEGKTLPKAHGSPGPARVQRMVGVWWGRATSLGVCPGKVHGFDSCCSVLRCSFPKTAAGDGVKEEARASCALYF